MFLDAYGMPIYSLYQFVPVPFQQSMEVLKAVLDSRMGHCRSLRSGVALSDALVPPYTPEEVDACEVYACSRHVGSALPVKSWKMRVKLFMQYSCSKVLALNLVISIRFVHFLIIFWYLNWQCAVHQCTPCTIFITCRMHLGVIPAIIPCGGEVFTDEDQQPPRPGQCNEGGAHDQRCYSDSIW